MPPCLPAAVGDSEYTFSESHQELAAWIVPGSAICSFVFACNQQRYWQHREFWSVALVTLPIVVVPAIRWALCPQLLYCAVLPALLHARAMPI
jgi:hypothetical protein